ncbi:hypothetical protein [Paracraurococcus lichenis]|uniref:Uncharacterized protein n=1 Tax=Paracraurococcus lichenis TaxID=3064888 RepID=A0ABT9E722_9PROT|nr:hypothetical protein [Paracraurococcus sp. LOR1-02]MDO9711985.1 hypothetical protein [Paracraurococcus sp. LOR1-02]
MQRAIATLNEKIKALAARKKQYRTKAQRMEAGAAYNALDEQWWDAVCHRQGLRDGDLTVDQVLMFLLTDDGYRA